MRGLRGLAFAALVVALTITAWTPVPASAAVDTATLLQYVDNDFILFWSNPTRAYPGIPLDFRFVVYEANNQPLTWSLTNAPAGMTIDQLGHVIWTPTTGQIGSYNITVTVTRPTGSTTQIQRTFTTVVGTSDFIFISPTGSDTNSGTIDSPFKTVRKAVLNMPTGDGKTIYMRGGTYYEASPWSGDNPWGSKTFTTSDPAELRSYPGEWATIDCQGTGNIKTMSGSGCVLDNFEEANAGTWGGIFVSGGNTIVRDTIARDSHFSWGDNCTGYLVMAPPGTVLDNNIGYNNRDPNSDQWNSSNFLFYTAGPAGCSYVLNCKSYGSVVGFKIKHAGQTKLVIHNCQSTGDLYGSGGPSQHSSVRYCTFLNPAIEGMDMTMAQDDDPNQSSTVGPYLVEHNTVTNASEVVSINNGHLSNGFNMQNNILFNNIAAAVQSEANSNWLYCAWMYDTVGPTFPLTSVQNDFYGLSQNNIARWGEGYKSFSEYLTAANDTTSVFGDPLFVDRPGGNVNIPTNSPANFGNGNFAGSCQPGASLPPVVADRTFIIPPPVPSAPTAGDDSYSVYANHTLTVAAATGLLLNDTGIGTLTAIKVSGPSHGNLSLSSDGSFIYTPTTGYTGSDSFTYKAHNNGGDSNIATVNITVNIVPAVTITSPNGSEVWAIGSTVAVTWTSLGTVGNVDIDLSADGGTTWTTLAASTANDGSQSLTVPSIYSRYCQIRVKQTSGGSPADTSDADFTITVAGDITCNGYVDGGDLNVLLSNWNKTGATWATGDLTGNGYVDGGDLNVLLSNWNVNVAVPPTAVDDSYSLYADHILTIAAPGVLANDIRTAPLTAVKISDPSHGSVTLNSDGSFTYTPTAGYIGSDSFTYKANNSLGDSNTATVSFTITGPTRVLIDCGSSYLSSSTTPNSDGRYWNNFTALTGSPSVITSCTTSTGSLSGIKLTRTTDFYYAGAVGYITAPVNGWPVTAAADYLNVNSTTVPGTMEFSLLDTSGRKTYELTIFGSVVTSSTTAYTVIAATTTSQQMNCSNNKTQWATFSNLTPDASGKITLQVNLLTSGGRAPLNVMDLAIYDNGAGATGATVPAGGASLTSPASSNDTSSAATTVKATKTIADNANNAGVPATASIGVPAVQQSALNVNINFQPASVVAPQGCLVDSGLPFSKNSNGYSYGWTTDLSANAVQRNSANSPDIRYDTAVMPPGGGTWEIAVPSGMYDVKIVCGTGDIGSASAQNFAIQGVPMTQTQSNTTAGWSEETITVVVTDGRLTITAIPGSSLCFVQITGR